MKLNPASALPEAKFDLTSMIDVVLLLIIFFMMTTQFNKSQSRPMDLPRQPGDVVTAEQAPAGVFIEIDRAGRVTVLGDPWEVGALAAAVKAERDRALARAEPLDIIVRAERSSPAVHLNALATALAAVGVTDWKLATAGGSTTSGGVGAVPASAAGGTP